jgi:hypothetical protein
VGKNWSQRIQQQTRKNKVLYTDIEYKVVSWEKIQTAKAEFEAFKIEVRGWASGQVRTVYYAPTAKVIVSLQIKTPNAGASAKLLDFNVSN